MAGGKWQVDSNNHSSADEPVPLTIIGGLFMIVSYLPITGWDKPPRLTYCLTLDTTISTCNVTS